MIKLSERLECIADRVDKGEVVADIGTDHGYLPIYLWENSISPKVIMADVSKGSLQKAKENCKLYHPNKAFDFRLGDGLAVLKAYEVDTVVMAGMGALLMIDILEWDIIKTVSYKKFILQPRNNLGELICWLEKNNFNITGFDLVKEGKRICEILTVRPGQITVQANREINLHNNLSAEYDFPNLLLEFPNKHSKEYLELHLRKEAFIIENILKGKDGDKDINLSRRISRRERLKYLLGCLDEIN